MGQRQRRAPLRHPHAMFCDVNGHRRVGAAGQDRRPVLARACDDLTDFGGQRQRLRPAVATARAARGILIATTYSLSSMTDDGARDIMVKGYILKRGGQYQ